MATTPGASAASGPARGGPQSQHELNQIVIEYLQKKGYTKTEAQLRAESQTEAAGDRPVLRQTGDGVELYLIGFRNLKAWVGEALDVYKPEFRRLLWPVFVYMYLHMISVQHIDASRRFFEEFSEDFRGEHADELRQFRAINSPAHLEESDLAKRYRGSKYRLTLSNPGHEMLVAHLEDKQAQGGALITNTISRSLQVVTVARTNDVRYTLANMLRRAQVPEDFPQEDEGIPGHNPGSANLDQNPGSTTLQRLKLGPLPMEPELLEDVMADLQDEDQKNPPKDGQPSLTDHFQNMIKVEDGVEVPNRAELPLPQSKARDVALEVMKVKENRKRFKIDGRTGGTASSISVCMFTFHNSNDGIICVDFSGDHQLIAAGLNQHYIRVWRVDGKPLPSVTEGGQPQVSRRLIGHEAPVYSVSFSPSIANPGFQKGGDSADTSPQYLLSGSGDKTIRLWDVESWTCLVIYEGHQGSVWDVQWGPFGYYFASGSRDGTARLWSTDHKSDLRLFIGHDQDVNYIAWHPNNAYVFTAGYDKTVRMFAVTTGQAVRMFTGHAGDPTSIACAPNGKLLASADDAGTIIVWELGSGKLLKRLRGHDKGGIHSLDWSAESNTLISGGQDGTVRVWDIQGSTDPTQQGKVAEGIAEKKMEFPGGQTGVTGTKRKGKDAVVSPEQVSAFPTKKSPVYKVKFSRMNLAMAAGTYLP